MMLPYDVSKMAEVECGMAVGSRDLGCRKRAFRVARCDRQKRQGAIARYRKVQHERVAGCEVVVLHLAKFGNCRVRCSRVAPCDISLVILRKTGGTVKVDANIWVEPSVAAMRGEQRRFGCVARKSHGAAFAAPTSLVMPTVLTQPHMI